MNEEKTEYTTVKIGSKEEEMEWRNVIKLGSKIGDWEEIQRRKELATITLVKNDKIWKKNWKTKLTIRIRLYETLVKSILLYNCGTWDLSKDDQRKMNSFHRRQPRKVIGIQWLHKISNNKLYKITGTKSLSITITGWKLLQEGMEAAGTHPETPSRLPCKKGDEVLFWREGQEDLQRKKNHHSIHSEWKYQAYKRRWHHLPSNTPPITS